MYDSRYSAIAPAFTPMTWGEAVKIFFLGSSDRNKVVITAVGARIALFVIKVFPFITTLIFGADDATIIGILNDLAFVVTVPMMIITGMWATVRIPWLHHRGQKPRRS